MRTIYQVHTLYIYAYIVFKKNTLKLLKILVKPHPLWFRVHTVQSGGAKTRKMTENSDLMGENWTKNPL